MVVGGALVLQRLTGAVGMKSSPLALVLAIAVRWEVSACGLQEDAVQVGRQVLDLHATAGCSCLDRQVEHGLLAVLPPIALCCIVTMWCSSAHWCMLLYCVQL